MSIRHCVLAMLQAAASLLLAEGARAQGSACDQLKGVLAARIDPSIRGFILETVTADTPVPPGAKVIGTCEGGARKILLRRGGALQAATAAASAVTPAPAPAPAPAPKVAAVPVEQARRTREVQADRVAPVAPAPASTPALVPVSTSMEAASAVAAPIAERAPLEAAPAASAPLAPQTSGFLSGHWRWIVGLLSLMLAAWLWAWLAHRRAYDEAGLPRGPKLN